MPSSERLECSGASRKSTWGWTIWAPIRRERLKTFTAPASLTPLGRMAAIAMSLPGKIADSVLGMFGGGGKGDNGQFKKDLEDANKSYVPMRFDPGTSRPKATQTAFSFNVDGRVLAQTVIEQMESLTEHATGAPAYNGQSHFNRADGGIMGT
jgi:hypothetical protein